METVLKIRKIVSRMNNLVKMKCDLLTIRKMI